MHQILTTLELVAKLETKNYCGLKTTSMSLFLRYSPWNIVEYMDYFYLFKRKKKVFFF